MTQSTLGIYHIFLQFILLCSSKEIFKCTVQPQFVFLGAGGNLFIFSRPKAEACQILLPELYTFLRLATYFVLHQI